MIKLFFFWEAERLHSRLSRPPVQKPLIDLPINNVLCMKQTVFQLNVPHQDNYPVYIVTPLSLSLSLYLTISFFCPTSFRHFLSVDAIRRSDNSDNMYYIPIHIFNVEMISGRVNRYVKTRWGRWWHRSVACRRNASRFYILHTYVHMNIHTF